MKSFNEIKQDINKKLLLISYLFLALLILCIVLFVKFIDHAVLSVLFFLPIIPLAYLFFRYRRKAMPPSFYEWVAEKALRGIAATFRFLFRPLTKLLKRLGFFSGKGFLRGMDERSFHFMRPGQKNRRRAERMPKWKNLTNNCQRVRFLFMKYLNYRIKKGFVFRKTLSPEELRALLLPDVDPEDEDAVKGFSLLFDNYPIARYQEETRAEETLNDPLVAEMKSLL